MAVKEDVQKAKMWQGVVREAARSGLSNREFCRQRGLTTSQFYWWQRRLQRQPQGGARRPQAGSGRPSFALVSADGAPVETGIELVLAGGQRLRIAKGVDAPTLRTVLAVVEDARC